jgi:UDP-N-acetylglucosamine 2-epimerase (non-hydrolysing)
MTPSLQPRSVAVVLGTRPEIIKLAPIIRLLGDAARVIHTGQHYDSNLSKVFFDAFGLPEPEERLAIGGISRGSQIGEATTGLDRLFAHDHPAAVVVQGDTNTVLAASLAANAREIALVHVEAGLRSFDRAMPEEHNRVIADHLSDLCLAPTEVSVANLRAESIPDDRIVVTGNTVVESVRALLPDAEERASHLAALGLEPGKFILSTLHRPENVDDADAFAAILEELAGAPLPVVLPIHPRSRANAAAHGLKHLLDSIRTVDPMAYPAFLALLAECGMAVADSGGIQEEVSILKRPLVVVRRSTERPEVIGTFAVRVLPGPAIGDAIAATLEDLPAVHRRLATIESPYGDGSAGRRSVAAIEALLAGDESG